MKDQSNITTMKDIAITLKQNKPGELAKAVGAIANAQVNIEGFTETDGKFHCVTDDPKSAQKALESAGFSVSETDVLVFQAEDRPGYFANVLRGVPNCLDGMRELVSVAISANVHEVHFGFVVEKMVV